MDQREALKNLELRTLHLLLRWSKKGLNGCPIFFPALPKTAAVHPPAGGENFKSWGRTKLTR